MAEALSAELYFAYGSNLDEQQMRERCPGSRALFRALLRDHRLDFTYLSATRWRGGTADILPEPGSLVFGLVYAMGDGDFAALDRFEAGYDRVQLVVEDDASVAHAVTSYRVREKGSFAPHELYLNKILREAERLRFPDDYTARLRARYRP